jgi:hemerythrin superfamily protein
MEADMAEQQQPQPQASGARAPGKFALDDPTRALMHDHSYVKELFQRYLGTQDIQVKQNAGPRICKALQMHTSLEEAVFYPSVKGLSGALIDKCSKDHQQAEQLITQLQAMQPGEAPYDQLMQQLRDAILPHIDLEEQQLFPAVRGSTLDLQDLALRMQAYESSIVASQARDGQAGQRGEPLH